ncbi:MAG: NADPH-dependent F420 reductase [Actinomycetes bacterium]
MTHSDDDAAAKAARAVVGILGGTGDQGRGLARRLGRAGNRVVLGSRDAARAAAAADELAEPNVRGAANAEAARDADVVIVAVPYEGHRDLLTGLNVELAGKVVVDCVNPIAVDKSGPHALDVPEGSAAEQAAAVLTESTVVAAFHHVSAITLLDQAAESVDTDVLVLGDERAATDFVQALAERIPGVRGVYAGRLRNARQVEALTANLIAINRRYKAHAGIRVTDV